MRTVTARPAADADLAGIGVIYDLSSGSDPRVVSSAGPGWNDGYTADPLVLGPVHVGLTTGPSLDAHVRDMERHTYTQEALLPVSEPVVLPVCTQPAPEADAVQALIVEPGQVLRLNVAVWHAPAMGISGPTGYYWLAEVDEAVESEWVPIEAGPVQVRL